MCEARRRVSRVPPGPATRLAAVATFKPVYLIHGDDHGRISERRARLRAIAEAESGTGGVEVFEGDAATPEAVAMALNAMTFAMGRRFVIVDGAERWKDADVEAQLGPSLAAMPPDTTVAFFAREEGRTKASAKLTAAVKKAGGDVVAENMLKAKELPRWVVAEADRLGIRVEGAAAQALVAQVGDRQQRLLRELEKLALEHGWGAAIGAAEIEASSASSAERKAWTLADALVAGEEKAAMRALVELRGQGERLPGLLFQIVRRLRDAVAVAEALAAGQAPAQARRMLRMPPKAAERFMADVGKRDVEAFRRALEVMADLELESRGGGTSGGALSEETQAVRALLVAAA
jgi:DNA polymerase III subunit delta